MQHSGMKVNFGRGFFRAWLVIAAAWIGVFCWIHYPTWWADWVAYPYTVDDDCSESLGKWPDGRKFEGAADWFRDYPADSDTEHNRWLAVVHKKIADCRAAKPFGERLNFFLTSTWSVTNETFPLMLLPPFALLLAGLATGWILKGFRVTSSLD
jgi:hypothetical protein